MVWLLMKVAEQESGGGLPAGAQVTMGFNRARLLEAAGNLQAAAREYEGILQVHAHLLCCWLAGCQNL